MNPAEMPVFFNTWQDFLNKFNDKAWTFQQFTGLKDKDGREIYEGDILETFVFKIKIIYIIVFENGNFKVKELGNPNCNLDLYDIVKNTKIIGNIYENPELL